MIYKRASTVDLVERPGVPEATIPNFVDDFLRMRFIFAARSCHYRQHGSPPDTLLMLLCEFPYPSLEELSRPSALSTQRTGPNLGMKENASAS